MIKRYRHQGNVIYVPAQFLSTTKTSETASTANFTTTFKGEPGAVLTFKVISYTHSSSGQDFQVDSVSKVLNDTFTRTLDGSGNGSFTEFVDVGTTSIGNGINVQVQIMSTSIGIVSSTSNVSTVSKTT